MKNSYSETYRITTNMLDRYEYLKPSAILDLCQNIAGNHATEMGIGFGPFYLKGWYWVVVRTKVEIVKNIKKPEVLLLKTYPLKPRFVEYPRDIEIYNENEIIIKVRTIWMIYNFKTKSIADTSSLEDFGSDFPGVFLNRVRRIPLVDKIKLKFIKKVVVLNSMIDHNGHMNNTRYLDLYLDIFGSDEKNSMKGFQVEYLKQCFLNDTIELYVYEENNSKYLYGYIKEELMFYLKADY